MTVFSRKWHCVLTRKHCQPCSRTKENPSSCIIHPVQYTLSKSLFAQTPSLPPQIPLFINRQGVKMPNCLCILRLQIHFYCHLIKKYSSSSTRKSTQVPEGQQQNHLEPEGSKHWRALVFALFCCLVGPCNTVEELRPLEKFCCICRHVDLSSWVPSSVLKM